MMLNYLNNLAASGGNIMFSLLTENQFEISSCVTWGGAGDVLAAMGSRFC